MRALRTNSKDENCKSHSATWGSVRAPGGLSLVLRSGRWRCPEVPNTWSFGALGFVFFLEGLLNGDGGVLCAFTLSAFGNGTTIFPMVKKNCSSRCEIAVSVFPGAFLPWPWVRGTSPLCLSVRLAQTRWPYLDAKRVAQRQALYTGLTSQQLRTTGPHQAAFPDHVPT